LFVGGGLSYGSSPVVGRSTAGSLFYAPVRREVDLLLGYRGRLPARLGQRPAEEQFNAANLLQQSPYTLLRRDPDGQNFRAVLNPPPTHSLSFRLSLGVEATAAEHLPGTTFADEECASRNQRAGEERLEDLVAVAVGIGVLLPDQRIRRHRLQRLEVLRAERREHHPFIGEVCGLPQAGRWGRRGGHTKGDWRSLGASGKRFPVRHRDAGSRLPFVGRL